MEAWASNSISKAEKEENDIEENEMFGVDS